VTTLQRSLALVAVTMISYSGTPLAAQETASEVTVARDLTAVIALQGLPCGQVVSATQQGEDDYVASCQDGNRYRVFVNAEGRVVVEKLD
jgi:hypothetical protein